jgi:hypothetical protein
VYELRVKTAAGALPAFLELLQQNGLEVHNTEDDAMRIFVPLDAAARLGANTDQQAIFALAARQRAQVRHLRASVPTLEDVFAKAVGEE